MKGSERNARCWCGSGKKLKKCHRRLEGQVVSSVASSNSDGFVIVHS